VVCGVDKRDTGNRKHLIRGWLRVKRLERGVLGVGSFTSAKEDSFSE